MSLRTNRPLSVLNPESWRVLHKNVQTGSLLLQRKTVMRSCFDFVKAGHVFAEKSQQFELAEVRDSRVAFRKNFLSGKGFEPTPPCGDQNARGMSLQQCKVSNLESGALDRSANRTVSEESGDCFFCSMTSPHVKRINSEGHTMH